MHVSIFSDNIILILSLNPTIHHRYIIMESGENNKKGDKYISRCGDVFFN